MQPSCWSVAMTKRCAFLTVIIVMITSGFVARYHRQASAASEDRLVQRIAQLSLELKEVHAEVQGPRPTGNGSETGSPMQISSTEAHEPHTPPDR
jgi:hypothetical protein